MDWANERYIRLYVRDTLTWQRLGWEGQAVLCLMLRKVHRSGVFELGGMEPSEGLTTALLMPVEIVERALPRLLNLGVLELGDDSLVMPKFIEAQETAASDAKRCRDYREKRRDTKSVGSDTKRVVRDTKREKTDTTRHDATRSDTPILAVPSLKELEPSVLVPHGTPGSGDEKVTPEDLVSSWNDAAEALGLAPVREVRGSRLRKVQLRLHEHPDPEFWQSVFTGLERSKFLTGQNGNGKGPHASWRASFDWLVENDVNATKVAEGRYA